MQFVVVGCGRVGIHLSNYLIGHGHQVTIIDKKPISFRKIERHPNLTTIVGTGFDRKVLESAKISEADGLAAVTSGDNSNVVIARVAKEIFKVPHVTARIYDPARASLYQRLGISTVASVSWSTEQFIKRLAPENDSTDWVDPTGEVVIVEKLLPDLWAGKPLSPLNIPGKSSIIAVNHLGKSSVAAEDAKGHEDDRIFLACQKQFLDELEDLIRNGAEQ